MKLADKVAIVTGASTGMGRAAAILFAAEGARVAVNYASSEKEAQKTVDTIKQAGGAAFACQANVADEKAADRLVAETVDRFGRLDILVNNAGTTAFIPFADMDAATPEVWMKLYSINVMGAFFCARAAAKEMRKAGGGVIVNNASVSGHRANGSSIPYLASKAALLHLTKCLAATLGPDIRVNSVSPGYIEDTLWTAKRENFDRKKAVRDAAKESLLNRTGTAEDVANAMLFLVSDQSSFCTGIDIMVDGGRSFKV